MSRGHRTVDPALFSKGEFRRANYVQRELWIGLIVTCCDDEGRFEADPLTICERLFSRAHRVSEKQVKDALDYWKKSGWLLLYCDDEYGFLTGWYEHQYIRTPEPSSLPQPPCKINSWAVVKQVKEWYRREHGGAENVHYGTVVRAWEQAAHTKCAESAHLVPTECALSADKVRVEVKGEVKREKKGEAPAHSDVREAEPPSPSGKTNSGRRRQPDSLSRYPLLAERIGEVYGQHWTPVDCNDFAADAAFGLDTPGCLVTEQEAVNALDCDATRPAVGKRGDWWIGDLDKAKRKGRPKAPATDVAGTVVSRAESVAAPPVFVAPELSEEDQAAARERGGTVLGEFLKQRQSQEATR